MAINLSRNTRMWVTTETVDANRDATNTYEIGIQDGYSFSSQLNSTDVTLNEAGAIPNRGSARFNDSTSPVDWSFATYIRPYTISTRTLVADAILWNALAGAEAHDPEWDNGTKKVNGMADAGTSFEVDFTGNGLHELGKVEIIFKVDNIYTTIKDVQVGQVEISVDIDGIGMTSWTGQGTSFETTTVAPVFIAKGAAGSLDDADLSTTGFVPAPVNAAYLKNKLSTVSLSSTNADGAGTSRTYSTMGLTGATVTINNNITHLTPETLGTVDTPIGSFTGSFDVSGSMTCYLDHEGTTGSYQLLSDLQANRNVQNSFVFALSMGGPTGERMEITMPSCHLAIPELSIDDVIGTSIEFKALPATLGTSDAGTEVTLKAKAA